MFCVSVVIITIVYFHCYITLLIFRSLIFVFQGLKGGPSFLQQLGKCLRLTAVQEAVFALALRHSSDPDAAASAESHLRTVVPPLVQSYVDAESGHQEGGLHDTTPEILHLILSVILKNPKEVGRMIKKSHLKTKLNKTRQLSLGDTRLCVTEPVAVRALPMVIRHSATLEPFLEGKALNMFITF